MLYSIDISVIIMQKKITMKKLFNIVKYSYFNKNVFLVLYFDI